MASLGQYGDAAIARMRHGGLDWAESLRASCTVNADVDLIQLSNGAIHEWEKRMSTIPGPGILQYWTDGRTAPLLSGVRVCISTADAAVLRRLNRRERIQGTKTMKQRYRRTFTTHYGQSQVPNDEAGGYTQSRPAHPTPIPPHPQRTPRERHSHRAQRMWQCMHRL